MKDKDKNEGKELQIFNNPEFGEVRTVNIDGEPWLVGKDVSVALGYANPQRAIRDHVDDEDKGVTEMVTPEERRKFLSSTSPASTASYFRASCRRRRSSNAG